MIIKSDLNLRHIPLHVISGEENSALAFQRGARSFLFKPVSSDRLNFLLKDIQEYNNRSVKEMLIIEDNELDSSQMLNVLNGLNVNIKIVPNGNEALSEISESGSGYDCIIVDYVVPDMEGNELIKKINEIKPELAPVIIYSAKDFNDYELKELRKFSNSVMLKGVNSFEKLMEESVIHLHLNHKELGAECREIIENIRKKEDILKGKSVLIVDDDVRNLFALTSALEKYEMITFTAESGMEAINVINNNEKIDMVLMDIMMPEMDGYETIKRIRKECKKQNLPIIAVTAKAMKGDRDKSISAGASDYITKPVNLENLLSLMRIWMYR